MVLGVYPDIFRARDTKLDSGRVLENSDEENSKKVIVLGYPIARSLFGDESAIGKKIIISGEEIEVIGILEKPKQSASPFGGLPELFRTALDSKGLSPLELDHILKWPDDQKEKVREAVVTALDSNRAVRFVWKLHDGGGELTDIRITSRGTIITFLSPWSKVRPPGARSGPVTPDDVTIDVG